MKRNPAHLLRKSGLLLLAVFLLPLLVRDVHYLFDHHHHDNHLQHCDVKGAHIHDPSHFNPENCLLCGVVYSLHFNDALLTAFGLVARQPAAPAIDHSGTVIRTFTHTLHLRGPPTPSIFCA